MKALMLPLLFIACFASAQDAGSFYKTTTYYFERVMPFMTVATVLTEDVQTKAIEKKISISINVVSFGAKPESKLKQESLSIDDAKSLLEFIELLREPLSSVPTPNPSVIYTFSPNPEFLFALVSSDAVLGSKNKWELLITLGSIDRLSSSVPLNKISELRDSISAAIAKAESL